MLESFKILEKKDSFYKLELSTKINMFHLSLLRKNLENFLSRQIISSLSLIMINDEQKFDVENIVDFRLINKTFNTRLQYKIWWVKHSSNRKWYSVENFENAKNVVANYHQRYFDKSSSHFLVIQFLFLSLMIHLTNSFSWAQRSIQKTKIMIENIINKMKKKWNSALLNKLRFLALNEIILMQKQLVKIISSLKHLTSKKSCLIKIEKKIMSRSCVNHQSNDQNQETRSISRRLINENKRRRFISFHNSFFLSHFFDFL
jgi:hypothetical protein